MPHFVRPRALDTRNGSRRSRPRAGCGIQRRKLMKPVFGKASIPLVIPQIAHRMPQHVHPRAVRVIVRSSCVYLTHSGSVWIGGSA
jgi:hypothetical protein